MNLDLDPTKYLGALISDLGTPGGKVRAIAGGTLGVITLKQGLRPEILTMWAGAIAGVVVVVFIPAWTRWRQALREQRRLDAESEEGLYRTKFEREREDHLYDKARLADALLN